MGLYATKINQSINQQMWLTSIMNKFAKAAIEKTSDQPPIISWVSISA